MDLVADGIGVLVGGYKRHLDDWGVFFLFFLFSVFLFGFPDGRGFGEEVLTRFRTNF